jgi:hypothetical protein
MAYKKPEVLAQNEAQGSYAAGCPSEATGGSNPCSNCQQCV